VRLFENYISSPFFEDDFFHVTYVQVMYLFWPEFGWNTFWTIVSLSHLVTLVLCNIRKSR
jgi:hypothetical protein